MLLKKSMELSWIIIITFACLVKSLTSTCVDQFPETSLCHTASSDIIGNNSLKVENCVYKNMTNCSNKSLRMAFKLESACAPRPTLVQLPIPVGFVDVIPTHVLIDRCGGFCQHHRDTSHYCMAHTKTTENIQVSLRSLAKYNPNYLNNQDQEIMMCSRITLIKHQSCMCSCNIDNSSCTQKQTFDETLCKCRCTAENKRQLCLRNFQSKEWDEDNCVCKCRPSQYHECSSGYVFDQYGSCRCIMKAFTTIKAEIALLAVTGGIIFVTFMMILRLSRRNLILKRKIKFLTNDDATHKEEHLETTII